MILLFNCLMIIHVWNDIQLLNIILSQPNLLTNLNVAHPTCKIYYAVFFWNTVKKNNNNKVTVFNWCTQALLSWSWVWGQSELKVSTYWYLTFLMIDSICYFFFLMGSILSYKWACIYHFICILIYIHFLSGKQINNFKFHWYDWQYSNILFLFRDHLLSDCQESN